MVTTIKLKYVEIRTVDLEKARENSRTALGNGEVQVVVV